MHVASEAAASAAGFTEVDSAAGFTEADSAAGFAEVDSGFVEVALAFAGGMAATDTEGMDTEATRTTDTDMGMDAGSQGHTGVSFTPVIETARAKRPAGRRVL
jgi:hypothetical protein